MSQRTAALFVVFHLLCLPAMAAAQGDGEPSQPRLDPTATVTTSARAPIEHFAADRSINVVDEETVKRRHADSITEALEEETGVMIESTNRGAGSVFLRGLVGPENLIYVDGVRFNQSTFRTGPNQYLNTIDPWALQRIEVVRGPGSILYGSGAMGGVIQVFPHELPTQDFELRVLGEYQSADQTAGAAADAGGHTNGLRVRAGATYRRHGELRGGQRGGQHLVMPGESGNRLPGSDFPEYYLRGGAGVDIGDRSLFRINYMGGQIDDATRVDRLGNGEVREYDNRDDLLWTTYTYDGLGLVDELRFNASMHRTFERVDRYNCETVDFDGPNGESLSRVRDARRCAELDDEVFEKMRINEDRVTTLGTSLTGVSSVADRQLRLSWGGEYYHDEVQSSRRDARAPDFEFEPKERGNFSDDSTYSSLGFFLYGRYRILRAGMHDLYLSGGGRVEHFAAFAPQVTDELGDVDYGFTGLVGSAGLSYLYAANAHVYLNFNQGFRAPNLQESTVLGDTGNFFEVPNAELGPERNNTFELGTKLDFPDLVRLQGAVFASLISDKITREEATYQEQQSIGDKPVVHRINAETAYYYGAEAGLETYSLFGASLFGNASVIDGAVESEEASDHFKPGPLHDLLAGADHYANPRRLPPALYLAGIRYSTSPDWYGEFFVRGAGPQDKLGSGDRDDLRICEVEPGAFHQEISQECPGTSGWMTLNIRGGYQLGELASLDAEIENLTDRRYKFHGSGPLGPGLNGKMLLTLNY